jgi:hypothetical protein
VAAHVPRGGEELAQADPAGGGAVQPGGGGVGGGVGGGIGEELAAGAEVAGGGEGAEGGGEADDGVVLVGRDGSDGAAGLRRNGLVGVESERCLYMAVSKPERKQIWYGRAQNWSWMDGSWKVRGRTRGVGRTRMDQVRQT